MPPDHEYYVYILASRSRTFYIGVTNNLRRRVLEHREGIANTFTAKYKIHRLVYYERFEYINNAIAREKYLKHFTREEKITLIESTNPTWEDLAADAFFHSLSAKLHNPKPCHPSPQAEDLLFAFVVLPLSLPLPSSCHPSRSGGPAFVTS